MANDEEDIEEVEGEEVGEDETEYAQGEVLFNALKEKKLVTESWESLDPVDQKKYQEVAEDLE